MPLYPSSNACSQCGKTPGTLYAYESQQHTHTQPGDNAYTPVCFECVMKHTDNFSGSSAPVTCSCEGCDHRLEVQELAAVHSAVESVINANAPDSDADEEEQQEAANLHDMFDQLPQMEADVEVLEEQQDERIQEEEENGGCPPT